MKLADIRVHQVIIIIFSAKKKQSVRITTASTRKKNDSGADKKQRKVPWHLQNSFATVLKTAAALETISM